MREIQGSYTTENSFILRVHVCVGEDYKGQYISSKLQDERKSLQCFNVHIFGSLLRLNLVHFLNGLQFSMTMHMKVKIDYLYYTQKKYRCIQLLPELF